MDLSIFIRIIQYILTTSFMLKLHQTWNELSI